MKKLFSILIICSAFTASSQQIADRLLKTKNTGTNTTYPNIVVVAVNPVTATHPEFSSINRDSVAFNQYQIRFLKDTLIAHKALINSKFPNPTGNNTEYLDGAGLPTSFPLIPNAQVQCDWNSVSGLGQILNLPSFSLVSTSGDYDDLINKPTIPALQVQSDWNAISGLGVILNKPTLFNGAYSSLTGSPALGTASAENVAYFATSSQGTKADNALQPAGNGSGLTGLTKSQVGLTNCDNTSDINKNVLSATKLATARTINGQSFDGTANITITATPVVGSPSSGNSITMGTAFQPRIGAPCFISVNASITGALGLNETITVAMSATSGGTYTTVATDVLLIGLLGLTLDRTVSSIPVPSGWYVKVTRSGSASTATYTKWDM